MSGVPCSEHTHTQRAVLTAIPPRTAPSSILSGRNTAPTNVHVILRPSDSVRCGACKVLSVSCRPSNSGPPGGQPLPACALWEPLCLQEEEQEEQDCAMELSNSAREMSCSQGPKPAFSFLIPKPQDLQQPVQLTLQPLRGQGWCCQATRPNWLLWLGVL